MSDDAKLSTEKVTLSSQEWDALVAAEQGFDFEEEVANTVERIIAARVAEAKAEAWDEGWNASSITSARRGMPDAWDYDPIKNPYKRDGLSE